MSAIVVIGGGLNGLVAAAALAKRQRKVVLLEQHETVGGAAITAEIAHGFRAPVWSHALGPVHPDVIRALRLDRAPIEWITSNPPLTVLGPERRMVVFHRDPVLTAGSINQVSGADAGRWQPFVQTMQRVAAVAGAMQRATPPSLDETGRRDWWALLRAGRHARRLGTRDTMRLARWVPMPIGDFLDEWFETPLVQTAVATRALFGNLAGPRSPGTTAMYLQRLGEDGSPVGGGVTARGGPGAVTQAIATIVSRAGAEVRTSARATKIVVRDGRVAAVVLEGGEEIPATTVVSAIDPKRTLIDLIDPGDLGAAVRERAQHIRARGVTAKINLALGGPPLFPALDVDPLPLRGRLLIADDLAYLERAFDAAKYGEISGAPWLELTVPTMSDPSLAVEGQHVMSIYAHFAPRHLRGVAWADRRDALYRAVLSVLEPHAPQLESLILGRQILTPEDLETQLGASGGHIFHGDSALDQTWIARPLLGWAQYRAPVAGLFFASAGAHPGGGLTGLPGLLAAKAVDRT